MHCFTSTVTTYLSANLGNFSTAKRYTVTFRQAAFTDGVDPAPTTLSSPVLINITDDGIAKGVKYFQAHTVWIHRSDRFGVRIGQDTVNVTITDSESFNNVYIENISVGFLVYKFNSYKTATNYTATISS